MSRDPYDDPYNRSNYADATASHVAYDQTYQTHHPDPSTDTGFQPNPSMEKMTDQYPRATERERKGRAGLNQTKSWAEVGPPPRSTGILRMWRKDERGKQWSRVSNKLCRTDFRAEGCGHSSGCAAAVQHYPSSLSSACYWPLHW